MKLQKSLSSLPGSMVIFIQIFGEASLEQYALIDVHFFFRIFALGGIVSVVI